MRRQKKKKNYHDLGMHKKYSFRIYFPKFKKKNSKKLLYKYMKISLISIYQHFYFKFYSIHVPLYVAASKPQANSCNNKNNYIKNKLRCHRKLN